MSEPIKTKFDWSDLEAPTTFIPCDYYQAIDVYPSCDDGATSSACNHCAFNIIDYCRSHDC